ncbi:histidine decarboxylase [Streptomyces yunnanensis]|uniref:L-histidine carboxy-lyase (Histamine-forming) n=1 Tax=Streptomyces yunnanensis TaxID=156453 RepID=A0A9X8MPR4_9ACTN|nr:histidine decarboxylase [Streptomyces yunnanensis]SHL35615.1 L-histidine carboxy-lyase (histamine-forming) [Streptomyces yunnanensis]
MTDVNALPQAIPQFPFGPDGENWEQALASQGLSNGHAAYVSAPVADPASTYPCEPGLDCRDFEIPAGGLSDVKRRKALSSMELYLAEKRQHFMGYQLTEDMNGYQQDLARFMENHINNIGDPFTSGGMKVNTKVAERAVLDYYAALWHAKWPYSPKDPESYWGYMLSMGSTEGNMYALWNGRDYLSGKALINPQPTTDSLQAPLRWVQAAPTENPNAYRPVAFYSQDTHYSFAKAVRILAVETFHALGEELYKGQCPLKDQDGNPLAEWPTEVPSRRGPSGTPADGPGDIDVDALATLVDFFAAKGHPILVSLNYGSTFKGAYDDVRSVCKRLLPIFEKYDLIKRAVHYIDDKTGQTETDYRRGFWIHVDGALGAGYGPFMRMAYKDPQFGWTPEVNLPEFDFGLTLPSKNHGNVDMVCSLAFSGHKWPGAPWPCGIYMTKVKYQMMPPSQVQYIGSLDTTFAGSRNGFSPLIIWDHLARHSYKDQVKRIRTAQALAIRMEEKLIDLEKSKGLELWPARTEGALTVRFRRPSDAVVAKWSLSTQDVLFPGDDAKSGVYRHYAHVFLMPGVTDEKINEFVADLANDPEYAKPVAMEAAALETTVQLSDGARSLGVLPTSGRGFQ